MIYPALTNEARKGYFFAHRKPPMTPQEQLADVAKAAPPITITSMSILGFPMSDWVLLATLIYTVIQIGIVVRRAAIACIDRKHAEKCGNAHDCPNRKDVG